VFSKYRTTNKKMMTRSKTANANNANKAIANEPKEEAVAAVAVESNMDDDKTVVYPSMFDRWREPW